MNLRQKAHELPERPGVYFLKDARGDILYVGKAKKLNKRVTSYFIPSTPQSVKNQRMLFFVTDFDYQLTDTELEALLLEQEMIAGLHPPYNRLMNYSERYLYISCDGELTVSKEPGKNAYGPFTMYRKIPELFRILNELYGLPNVKLTAPSALELHRKRYVSLPELSEAEKTEAICAVLKGGDEGLVRLQALQDSAVEAHAFEWAQTLQEDKEILKLFRKQAQLLAKILEPKPQIIKDQADEGQIKLFYTFQGSILASRLIPADVSSKKYRSFFKKVPLPPVKSFIPQNEIDKCFIISRYLN